MPLPAPFEALPALRRGLLGIALGIVLTAGLAADLSFAQPVALASAHRVTVEFIDPDRFADLGRRPSDRERATVALLSAFETLAAPRLKDSQSMDIEVLNIDLAGHLLPSAALPGIDIRVRRIGLEPAVIVFRWTLWREGHALASGEERLTHIDGGGRTERDSNTHLGVERGMLERWFDLRLGRPSEQLGARRPGQP